MKVPCMGPTKVQIGLSCLQSVHSFCCSLPKDILTGKAPNTTIAEFANTADPDETANNEPSHLDLQCLPSSL